MTGVQDLHTKKKFETRLERLAVIRKQDPAGKAIDDIAEAAMTELQKNEGVGSPSRTASISQQHINYFKQPINEIAKEIYKKRMPVIGLAAEDADAIKEKITDLLTKNVQYIRIPDVGEPSKKPDKVRRKINREVSDKDEFISAKSDSIFNAMLTVLLEPPSISSRGR